MLAALMEEMDFLRDLNPRQREAVEATEGPVMVIAGPGSGKTRVLTYRIAHLLRRNVQPHRILALTFTNKAAREMRERITALVGPQANSLWMGTFHSVFARILRREAHRIGYPSHFTIYDTEDSKNLIREILQELKLDPQVYAPNALRTRISLAKSRLISPEEYERIPRLRQADEASRRPHTYLIYHKYVEYCRSAAAMDFDDLLYYFYHLLDAHPDVLDKYRQLFQYTHVDEFQDTNHLQYRILKKLTLYPESPENICIVGDDAQSIYAFRGADISNILSFQKDYHNVKVIKLEQNYRSTAHIVQAANKLISYNRRQIEKSIWTDRGEGAKIHIMTNTNEGEEGRRVAQKIQEICDRYHLRYRDIAVLYRMNALSRVFEEYLRRLNIPYKIFGGITFYQRKEVKDMLAYLRLIVNPHDSEALKRVINYPKRGIGKASVERILDFARSHGISMWRAMHEAALPTKAHKAAAELSHLIQRLHKLSQTEDAYTVAYRAFKLSGLERELKRDDSTEGVERLQNVLALLDGIKEFVEAEEVPYGAEVDDRSLYSYLQHIALLTDIDLKDDDADYVSLMTVHSAKGLEFEAVFVVGLEENLFPSFQTIHNPREIEEERRLFYVAITRAKRFLILSHAESRYLWGRQVYNEPSRFIRELPEESIEFPVGKVKVIPDIQEHFVTAPRAKISGTPPQQRSPAVKIDPQSFTPSPPEEVRTGQRVLHLQFGVGKVLTIDGVRDKRVATIKFDEIPGPPKRIMLKFARLQILN